MTAPAVVDGQLVEKARELAQAHRGVPSRNQLKTSLRVGSEKAAAVRAQLVAEHEQRRGDRRRQMKAVARRGRQTRVKVTLPTGPEPGPAFEPPMVLPSMVFDYAEPIGPQPESQVNDLVPVPDPDSQPLAEPTTEAVPTPRPEAGLGRVVTWPALVVAAPAFVAIWAGWVGIGKLTGFGRVNLLPGFGQGWVVDTAITLPVGVEAYAAYAFYVALNRSAPAGARRFAAWSALGAVVLGMGGQTAYHLMGAAGMSAAPWQITTFVSCLPVAVFGLAAALVHMVRAGERA